MGNGARGEDHAWMKITGHEDAPYRLLSLLAHSSHISKKLGQGFRSRPSCLQFNNDDPVTDVFGQNMYSARFGRVFFTLVDDRQALFELLDIGSQGELQVASSPNVVSAAAMSSSVSASEGGELP